MTGIDPNAQDPGKDEAAEETNAHARDEAEQQEGATESREENAQESDGYGY